MKSLSRLMIILLIAATLVLSIWAGKNVTAQAAGESDKPDDPGKMFADMIKYATPGEHHDHLKPLAGNWNYTTRFRNVEQAPWDESKGEGTLEWALGGRFLVQKVKSPATEAFPMDFEGFGLIGYDNFAGEYWTIWTDNFSTGVMHFRGTCDESGKVITMTGEYDHPMWQGATMKERWVIKVINNDKWIFEMYRDAGDDEFKHGEITYTRKK